MTIYNNLLVGAGIARPFSVGTILSGCTVSSAYMGRAMPAPTRLCGIMLVWGYIGNWRGGYLCEGLYFETITRTPNCFYMGGVLWVFFNFFTQATNVDCYGLKVAKAVHAPNPFI